MPNTSLREEILKLVIKFEQQREKTGIYEDWKLAKDLEALLTAKTTEARIEETALNDRMAGELSFTEYWKWCKDRLEHLQQLSKEDTSHG